MNPISRRNIDAIAIAIIILLFLGGIYFMWEEFITGIHVILDLIKP